jgi:hypothetical protein
MSRSTFLFTLEFPMRLSASGLSTFRLGQRSVSLGLPYSVARDVISLPLMASSDEGLSTQGIQDHIPDLSQLRFASAARATTRAFWKDRVVASRPARDLTLGIATLRMPAGETMGGSLVPRGWAVGLYALDRRHGLFGKRCIDQARPLRTFPCVRPLARS